MDQESVLDIMALVVLCGLALLMAWITRYRPPKRINWLYGYRTARSMRTPATWQEANSYFARYFWWLSLSLPVVAVAAYLLVGPDGALIILLATLLLGMVVGLVLTERRLHRLFDSTGQPRR